MHQREPASSDEERQSKRRTTAPPTRIGPMPTGRHWQGMPVPFFFQSQTADAFRSLQTRDDDVIMASLVKGGTTWVHKILHLILQTDGGELLASEKVGSQSQVYPEAIVLRRGSPPDPENPAHMDTVRTQFFGDWGFEDDLCAQPSPRLFSTHLHGAHLPSGLIAPDGRGRLVVVLRNLKDTLTSLHFFRGEAKDGWLGNEHGPGSLERFIHPDCPNAYGSPFGVVRRMDDVVRAMEPSGRALVVYYEDLVRCLPVHIQRIATFLRVSLPPEKLDAIESAVRFDAMKDAGGMAQVLLRKGGIGDVGLRGSTPRRPIHPCRPAPFADGVTCERACPFEPRTQWRNHMGAEHWARFDAAFDQALDGVGLAEPMRIHQAWQVEGMPAPRATQTIADDPRSWGPFVRKTLVEGRVVRDALITRGGASHFERPPSEFNGVVMPPGTPGARHVAEPGRYHLFVAGVCPWATATRAARCLLGLEDVVSMDVADGQSGAGWVLLGGASCAPWAGRGGPFFLHEAYQASDPLGTTRITMPVLWDTQRRCIVSNDSWAIVKMFASAFRSLGRAPDGNTTPPADLVPADLAAAMEEVQAAVYRSLLNGVYKAGIERLKGHADAADAAGQEVYATLDELEAKLTKQRFLMGTREPTAVDLRLTMTLLRYDIAYRHAFGLDGGRGGIFVGATEGAPSAYPALSAHTRDVYSRIRPAIDWPSFLQYYRWGPFPAESPIPSAEAVVAAAQVPHGREGLDLPLDGAQKNNARSDG